MYKKTLITRFLNNLECSLGAAGALPFTAEHQEQAEISAKTTTSILSVTEDRVSAAVADNITSQYRPSKHEVQIHHVTAPSQRYTNDASDARERERERETCAAQRLKETS